MVPKIYLYYLAAIIWGIPGIMLLIKGVNAYACISENKLLYLFLITVCVTVFFFIIFNKIVKKYCTYIFLQNKKTSLLHTFPLKGWILVICMSLLGVLLKYFPLFPIEFTASFYCGLGPMLLYSSYLFISTGYNLER